MNSYRKDAEGHGAKVALNCEVVGGDVSGEDLSQNTLDEVYWTLHAIHSVLE